MSRNKLNLKGRVATATLSSLLLNVRFVPPVSTLASINLNTGVGMFVLSAGEVTVNTGPNTDFPKTDRVIGPLMTPKGTIVVMALGVSLTTRASTPLNWTLTFRD